ncbi:hypothetical protein ACFU8W_51385 [Streptomyces sp. NPDC057565]|uniref:hypothetical protein n=1 Tax=Streptomyces sp. NPDC057565 TaxID=3346169 RepID=UPI0036884AE1
MAATRAAPEQAHHDTHHGPRAKLSAGWSFLLRRLGFYLVTSSAAVTLNFLIPRFMPGSPAVALLKHLQQTTGQAPNATPVQAVRVLREPPAEPPPAVPGGTGTAWRTSTSGSR